MTRRPHGMTMAETIAWFGVPTAEVGECRQPDRLRPQRCGYYMVRWQGRVEYLHRLAVAWKLGLDALPTDAVVRHDCGNNLCVNPWHLLVGTHAENMRDQYRHGTRVHGDRHPMAKLSDAEVEEIRCLLAQGALPRAIAERFNVSRSCVSDIRDGRRRVDPGVYAELAVRT